MKQVQEVTALAQVFLEEDLTSGQEKALEILCTRALQYWKGRLREDVREEDYADALELASAWKALAEFSTLREVGGELPLSFSAGDISVSAPSREPGQMAKRLLDLAETIMESYCTDKDFVFRGVKG